MTLKLRLKISWGNNLKSLQKTILMKTLITLLCFILPMSLSAQNSILKSFVRSNSSLTAEGAAKAQDNGYLIAGAIMDSNTGNRQIYVVKLDSIGDVQWAKTYGDTGSEYCFKIKKAQNGGYFLIGGTRAGLSNSNMYLVKTDDTGKVLWSKTYGGIKPEGAVDMLEDSSGDLFILGGTGGYPDTSKVYIVRADSAGNLKHSNVYQIGWRTLYPIYIGKTFDNDFLIAGTTEQADTLQQSSTDEFLMKIDTVGNVIWAKAYNIGYSDDLISAVETFDNNTVLLGWSYDDTYWGASLIKVDSNGNRIWTKLFGYYIYPTGLLQTTDSGFIIGCGEKLIKTDVSGNVQWGRNIRNNIQVNYLDEKDPSTFVFTGRNFSFGRTDSLGHTCHDTSIAVPLLPASNMDMNPFVARSAIDSFNTITTPVAFAIPSEVDLCLTMTVNELPTKPKLLVYPNPASEVVTFQSEMPISTLQMRNSFGQTIVDIYPLKKNVSLNTSGYSKGIYFYRVTIGKQIITGKIVLY
jgi:hypothetical protein